LPEAKWVCCGLDDTETLKSLGVFDVVVSNPPYGNVQSMAKTKAPRYKGELAHLKAIDIASNMANYGVFLIPQADAGFKISNVLCYSEHHSEAYLKFHNETGIELAVGCGIDTSVYPQFKNAKITTEIAVSHFPVEHTFADADAYAEDVQLLLSF